MYYEQGNISVVTGDEGRLGGLDVCLHLQGETKTLTTLFAKLKAYFKPNYSTQ